MMIKRVNVIILPLLAVCVAIWGCSVLAGPELPSARGQDGQGSGTVVLRYALSGGARTLLPDFSAAGFTRFELLFIDAEKTKALPNAPVIRAFTVTDAAYTSFTGSGLRLDLKPGKWQLTITGYAGNTPMAQGSASFEVVSGAASPVAVAITLDPLSMASGGQGYFAWDITLDTSVVHSAGLSLTPISGNAAPFSVDVRANPSGKSAALDAGCYQLRLEVTDAQGNSAIRSADVQIWPGLTTTASGEEYTVKADDFVAGNDAVAFRRNSSGGMVFYGTLQAAINAALESSAASETITVIRDITATQEFPAIVGKAISVVSRDYATIKRGSSGQGHLFTVGTNGTLTLGGGAYGELIIDGGAVWLTLSNTPTNQPDNTTSNGGISSEGSLVHVTHGGAFTMEQGAYLQNNERMSINIPSIPGNGAAVWVESGNFVMNGGKISSNGAEKDGGAVYVDQGSIFTLKNGLICYNFAQDYGGGVFVADYGTFIMEGGKIAGLGDDDGPNIMGTSGTENTLCVEVNGIALWGNGVMGIIGSNNQSAGNGVSSFIPKTPGSYSTRETLAVWQPVAQLSGVKYHYLQDAIDAATGTNPTNPGVITILRDFTLIEAIRIDDVHIQLVSTEPVTIKRGLTPSTGNPLDLAVNPLITVISAAGPASLTLGNGTGWAGTLILDGGAEWDYGNPTEYQTNSGLDTTGSIIVVNMGAALIMNREAVLQNNSITVPGVMPGGVEIGYGSFTMNGGSIRNNATQSVGGGVSVKNGGSNLSSFIMRGDAEISWNYAENYGGLSSGNSVGGGLYVEGASVTMRDNATISHNVAYSSINATHPAGTGALGGGVGITATATFAGADFTMEDNATISYNAAKGYNFAFGGGLYVGGWNAYDVSRTYQNSRGGSNFTMKGGSIEANQAYDSASTVPFYTLDNWGGGVFYISDSTSANSFQMIGGVISSNSAGIGGGVVIAGGKFAMSKAANTESIIYGGNVPNGNYSYITINNIAGGSNDSAGHALLVWVDSNVDVTIETDGSPYTYSVTGPTINDARYVNGTIAAPVSSSFAFDIP